MNYYTKGMPSLYGILSDDQIYFEGLSRPSQFYSFRDESVNGENINILEKYFNDLYNLFLRKLSTYVTLTSSSNDESLKLQALLQELIKVKELIEKAVSTDIIGR